jgi:ubiquinone/menaquinone biosynthesis C-methylase UbiE
VLSDSEHSEAAPHSHPAPGSPEYSEHLRAEIAHYSQIFNAGPGRENLVQPVPSTWDEIEARAARLVRERSGRDQVEHVIHELSVRSESRMLSLGSGPSGLELAIGRRVPRAQVMCIDINSELLDLGRERAHAQGLNFAFELADLNTLSLPTHEYDVVMCHAALHHVAELERLVEQIKHTLRPGGVFITEDVITPNGYMMWPETLEVVRNLWRTLPARFRVNHTAYAEPTLDDEIWAIDQSADRMECIRSEEIVDILSSVWKIEWFVPYFTISRRFFDHMYGPNYDLRLALDRALLDWIWELDLYYLRSRRLRPETFFAVYRQT